MPGVYREKVCPVCDKVHRKRGKFCGQSCANSQRPISDNIRKNMRNVARDFNQTPAGIAQQKMFANTVFKSEDFAIDIPVFRDVDDYDILDGYEPGEKW